MKFSVGDKKKALTFSLIVLMSELPSEELQAKNSKTASRALISKFCKVGKIAVVKSNS